jgi:hypothetical protein
MLFGVADIVWQALIGASMTIIMAWMKIDSDRKIRAEAREAAGKAEEVKCTLAASTTGFNTKLDNISTVGLATQKIETEMKDSLNQVKETGDKVHTLVNNAMGIQLKLTATLAKRVSLMPNATVEDKEIAEAAQQIYEEHMAKQARVDRGVKEK